VENIQGHCERKKRMAMDRNPPGEKTVVLKGEVRKASWEKPKE